MGGRYRPGAVYSRPAAYSSWSHYSGPRRRIRPGWNRGVNGWRPACACSRDRHERPCGLAAQRRIEWRHAGAGARRPAGCAGSRRRQCRPCRRYFLRAAPCPARHRLPGSLPRRLDWRCWLAIPAAATCRSTACARSPATKWPILATAWTPALHRLASTSSRSTRPRRPEFRADPIDTSITGQLVHRELQDRITACCIVGEGHVDCRFRLE